jgi:predicted glycogen debranching enzyme
LTLPKINVGRDILSDINTALDREWLVTNGLGGYASSTILGINTRKYHGLLIAAFNPPVNRWVLLSKLDESLQIRNLSYDLGANEFSDVMHPTGYRFLSEFMLTPLPSFRYIVNGFSLHKTILMPYMKNATAIIYKAINTTEEEVEIHVSPLVNSRHIYDTTDKNKIDWGFTQRRQGKAIIIEPSDSLSSLILSSSNDASFVEESWWIEKMFFRVDASRNESSIDDNFRPGFFRFTVNPKETKQFYLMALAGKNGREAWSLLSSFDHKMADIDILVHEELERRQALVSLFSQRNVGLELKDWLKWLVQAADSFIVFRASTGKKSVIAGYSWFDDWGRDALISLPGLTLVTGRFENAQEILLTFKRNCKNGIIPNRFSDKAGDIPLYNTVDATLWFFNSILQYLKYTGDFEFVKTNLWNTLNEIIDYHVSGTIFGIHMEDDGLIAHGPQLTWMDATTMDGFVTPRDGKAVEIQALWYNALRTMQVLAKRFHQSDKSEKYNNMAEKAKASFLELYWNPKNGYLADVVCSGRVDLTLRPNQLIALSLDFPLIEGSKSESVVEAVWNHLWGTYGLRTLPKTDPRYNGKYFGDWGQRDGAYHNGTVWSWLLGPFITAFLKTKNHEESWRNFAFTHFLQPLFSRQLFLGGLGTISEIFDGNKPHFPRGCISQAWSIAEPLRAYVEEIAFIRPPYEKEVIET